MKDVTVQRESSHIAVSNSRSSKESRVEILLDPQDRRWIEAKAPTHKKARELAPP
jgi:hypothetical protein